MIILYSVLFRVIEAFRWHQKRRPHSLSDKGRIGRFQAEAYMFYHDKPKMI